VARTKRLCELAELDQPAGPRQSQLAKDSRSTARDGRFAELAVLMHPLSAAKAYLATRLSRSG
jgi:hypothetical protein